MLHSLLRHSFFFLLIAGFISCTAEHSKQTPPLHYNQIQGTELTLKYATGFRIKVIPNGYALQVLEPFPGSSDTISYFFIRSTEKTSGKNEISIPVRSMICTSTSHIPLLDYLKQSKSLKGFPGLDYICSPLMREEIDKGNIVELGLSPELNMEKVIEIYPDLIMSYAMNQKGMTSKLQNIPVLFNTDYNEEHPLGRAEWIKVAGIIYDLYEQSDSIFNAIEKKYNDLKNTISDSTKIATVFSGSLYGDSWYMPGGNNYASRLLQDAGYKYLWDDNQESSFLQLSFEHVIEKAKDGEYWIGPAPFPNLNALKEGNERYASFKAFNNKKVYTYDGKKGPKGGNEYLELGYLRPDIILQDLIKIKNPDLFEGESLYFYRKLE